MGDTYWPDSTLADLLDIHVQNYEQDFRKYWNLDAESPPEDLSLDEWRLVKVLDRLGRAAVPSARSLRILPELAEQLREYRPADDVHQTARELVNYNVAQSCAEIELAQASVHKLFEGKTRLMTVVQVLSEHELSERALAYVDRMIQCYIWSMDTECVVMARSVVETALQDAIPEDELEKAGFARKRHGFDFWQYRDAARALGRLDAQQLDSLDRLRHAANVAVHASPGLHEDPIVSLAYAVICLRALFPI